MSIIQAWIDYQNNCGKLAGQLKNWIRIRNWCGLDRAVNNMGEGRDKGARRAGNYVQHII